MILLRHRLSSAFLSLFVLWLFIPGALLGSGRVDYVPQPFFTAAQTEAQMHNAEVAAERIDGRLLWPGEEFSFWEKAGPFDSAHSYVYGFGVLNGKVVPAFAGGVCITSTAVYRAVYAAGLEVLERHVHGVPLKWARGDDAAVSFRVNPDGTMERGWDLRFRNTSGVPLVVKARRSGRTVKVELRKLEPLAKFELGDW